MQNMTEKIPIDESSNMPKALLTLVFHIPGKLEELFMFTIANFEVLILQKLRHKVELQCQNFAEIREFLKVKVN